MSSRKKSVQVTIRQRLDPLNLYNAFITNSNYTDSEILLIKHISNFLPYYIQNDNCRKKEVNKNTLLGIMCEFSYAYVANPITIEEKEKDGSLVNGKTPIASGINGRIYHEEFDGNPIITKAPVKFNEDNIKEIFINFVLINSILSHNKLVENLVPSYGLFICPSNTIPEDEDAAKKVPLQICLENPKKDLMFRQHQPFVYLVQKKVDGVTLNKKLKEGISLDTLKEYLGKVFMVMACLENSPFLLAHNDLHTGNIMINDKTDEIVIIDWGMASFKDPISGTYYQPFLYDYYTWKDEAPIVTELNHTAASDFLFLFSTINDNTTNNDIKEYTKLILEKFMKKFKIYNKKYKKSSWLLGTFLLYDMETIEYERDYNTFKHNSKVLKESMYLSLALEFELLTDEQIQKIKEMNRYWYSHLQIYKDILTIPQPQPKD